MPCLISSVARKGRVKHKSTFTRSAFNPRNGSATASLLARKVAELFVNFWPSVGKTPIPIRAPRHYQATNWVLPFYELHIALNVTITPNP